MNDRLAPGVTILGSGAACGKTWHTVGLLGALKDRGHHPVPFKAVAIVDPADLTSPDPRRWARAIHHHLMAAGLPYSPHFNPVTVVPSGAGTGELFLLGEPRGEVQVIADDQVGFAALPEALYAQCAEAVVASLTTCRRVASFVVVEGAGDAGCRSSRPDLANAVAPSAAGFPVVTVFRPDRSAHSTLAEFLARIPTDVKQLVSGVVVNNPQGTPIPGDLDRTTAPVVAVGRCELPPADGTIAGQRARNHMVAGHVWNSIPWTGWLTGTPVRTPL